MNEANRCPVCQARFRGAGICSRCGADLGRLMLLAADAWRLREAARTAIAEGEFGRGFELAARAQEAQSTRAGEALRRLGEWLGAGRTLTPVRNTGSLTVAARKESSASEPRP